MHKTNDSNPTNTPQLGTSPPSTLTVPPLGINNTMHTMDFSRYFDQVPVPEPAYERRTYDGDLIDDDAPARRKNFSPHVWTHLTLKDNLGYHRSWVKTEYETLGSLIASYAKYSGMKEENFILDLRTVPISSFEPLHALPLMNGDTLTIVTNPNSIIPLRDRKLVSKILSLSPEDQQGVPYRHYEGPITRQDEAPLQVLLKNIWPGMPTVAIECRAKQDQTLEQILLVFREALGKPTLVWEDPALEVNRTLSHITYPYLPVILRMISEPKNTDDDLDFHLGPGMAGQDNPVSWIIHYGENPNPEEQTIGLWLPQDTQLHDVLAWITQHFALDAHPYYLRHGLRILEHRTLGDNGFMSNRTYEVSLIIGSIPTWALRDPEHPPTIDPSVPDFSGDYVLKDEYEEPKYFSNKTRSCLANILSRLGYQNMRELRILHNGTRLSMDSDLSNLPPGSELEVHREQTGGGGRVTTVPRRGPAGSRPRPPPPHEIPNPTDEYSRGRTRTRIMGKHVGQRHGLLRGPYQQIPDPGPTYARLQLRGPMIGFWGAVLSNGSSLSQITGLLEELYGDKLLFSWNGESLGPNRTIGSYRLTDGAIIDVARASPPDIAPEDPLEDPDALRYIQPGYALQLPPALPGSIKLQLRSEKTGLWAATIRTDAPFSLIADHINHQYRESFRFCLDGTRLAETMTVAENMLENGDDIDIYSEQVGGGDINNTHQDAVSSPQKEPKALRYLIEGTLKHLPPLPGYIRIQLLAEDKRIFAATIRPDAPFSLLANRINKEYGHPLRYVLDGTRIAESLTLEQNDISNEDQIDVHKEMTGGGDVNQPTDEDEYDQDGQYSETNHELHPSSYEPPPAVFSVSSPSNARTMPVNSTATSSQPQDPPLSSPQRPYPQIAPEPSIPVRKITIPTRSTIDAVGKFKGRNAKAFIRKYEALGARTNATPEDLIQDLSFYVEDIEPDIFSLIEAHSSYVAKDWAGIKRYILTGFEGPDTDKYTEHDLAVFVSTPRSIGTITELNHYSLSFKDMGDKLLQRGQIGSKQYLQYFVRGLPDDVLTALADSTLEDESATFQDVLEEVQRFFQPSTFFKKASLEKQRERAQLEHRAPTNGPALDLSLVSGRLGSDKDSVLVKQLERISLNFAQAMDKAAHPSLASARFIPQTTGAYTTYKPTFPSSQPRPPTGSNNQWSVSTNQSQAPPPQWSNHPQAHNPPSHWNGPSTQNRAPPPATSRYANLPPQASNSFNQLGPGAPTPATGTNTQPLRSGSCVYCNDPTHGRDRCPIFADHSQKGIVRLMNNNICWSDGTRVLGLYGFLQEVVNDRLRATGDLPSSSAQTNYLTFVFPEEPEEEYDSYAMSTDATKRSLAEEEASRNTRPRLTRSNIPAAATSSQTPGVRFELPGGTAPNTYIPSSTPFPIYQPDTPQAGQPTDPSPSAEAIAEDSDSGDDTATPGKPPRLPNLWKRARKSKMSRLSRPQEVAQSLMTAPVTLPWHIIAGISPEVQKGILEHLRGEKVPWPVTGRPVPWSSEEAEATPAIIAAHLYHQLMGSIPRPPTPHQEPGEHSPLQANHFTLNPEDDPPSWYTRGLPMITVYINGKGYRALLDSGSQINVMKARIQQELRLPLRFDGKHVVVGAGQHKTNLAGIVEHCPIRIGSVTASLHFFVQERCGYDILFGMPALNTLRISIDCVSGNATMATDDNKMIELQVVDPYDPAHTDTLEGSAPSRNTNESNYHYLEVNEQRLIKSQAWTNKPSTYHLNTKRKSVEDKIRPTAAPSSAFVHQPLRPITFTRDPYLTPLTPQPPPFTYTSKLTEERIKNLHFGPDDFINVEERNLLLHVLKLRSDAIAFDKQDKRFLSEDIAPPFVINTIPHTPWTDFTPTYPKADRSNAIALLKDQIRDGDLEYSESPYVTSHFFVKKKDNSLRLIIDMRSANSFTIRDANIPPYLPDYVDGFVGRVCYGLGDLLSFFDQLRLHPDSRLLTAIRTPLGLLQKTGLPQGGTNSPAVAQRVSDHVGGDDVPEHIVPFIDDFGVKGPKSHYDNVCMPGTSIRRWVYEYAVILERFLFRIESAHLVVSGSKFIVITDELDITGIKVGFNGKRPDPSKIDKLQAWENPCSSQSSLRGFLGIANFLRPFIPNFATIDAPLRQLVGKKWKWSPEASKAMVELKKAALGHNFLGVIDYHSDADLVLSVDSSQIAAGFVLYQQFSAPKGKVIILYDSIAMTEVEQRYSQPKLELCGVYKAIRKLRYHLIGARFILEVDAMSLKQMINSPDVTNAAMIRWIAHLKDYDFTIRHIAGKTHIIPDGLSRAHFNSPQEADPWPDSSHIHASNNNELDAPSIELPHTHSPEQSAPVPSANNVAPTTSTTPSSSVPIQAPQAPPSPATNNDPLPFQEDKYSGRLRLLGHWLSTGGTHSELSGLPRHDRKWLRLNLTKFFLDNGRLFRRNLGSIPLLVLDTDAEKLQAQQAAHEDCGHRGRDAMAATLLQRVWWESIRGDCLKHARSCTTCQLRAHNHESEANRFAPIARLFETWALDIVYLGGGTVPRRYLVLARDLLSGWLEGRALPNKLASSVAKFIEDDILSRYGPVVRQILTDNGPENAGETQALLSRLNLRHARITPNHPQGNAIVERGHAPVVEGLLKAAYDDRERTFLYLPQILWADRITARRAHGLSPFELVFGYTPLLPIDYDLVTFQFFDWTLVHSTSALLACRARQLRRRDQDLANASALLQLARSLGREYADSANSHRIRDPLAPGSMALVRSTSKFLGKSEDRWLGPYIIKKQLPTGSYELAELDGTLLTRNYGSDRLRQYFPRSRPINEQRSFLDTGHDGIFEGPFLPPPQLPQAFEQHPLPQYQDEVHLTDDFADRAAIIPAQHHDSARDPEDAIHTFQELPFPASAPLEPTHT